VSYATNRSDTTVSSQSFFRLLGFHFTTLKMKASSKKRSLGKHSIRIITGDECGLLKECILDPSSCSSTLPQRPDDDAVQVCNVDDCLDRRRGLTSLAWTLPARDEQFAALRLDGSVQLWQRGNDDDENDPALDTRHQTSRFAGYLPVTEINAFKESLPIHESTFPLGLFRLPSNGNRSPRLLVGNAQGHISILQPMDEQPVVAQFGVYDNPKDQARLIYRPDLKTAKSLQPSPLATCLALDTNRVAVGGRDRDVVLCDVETGQLLWKAKNLPPDPQTLLQPMVWPTALCFFPHTDGAENGDSNPHILAVGTAHSEVRLYDIRQGAIQRRPIAVTPHGVIEGRVTSLAASLHELLVGDCMGTLLALDVRKLLATKCTSGSATTTTRHLVHKNEALAAGVILRRYAGPVGSIRALSVTGPHVAAAGLDRMLRLYHSDTRQQQCSLYLKQRLNCILTSNESGPARASVSDEEGRSSEEDDEDDDGESEDNNQSDSFRDDVKSFEGESDEEAEGQDCSDDPSEDTDESVDDGGDESLEIHSDHEDNISSDEQDSCSGCDTGDKRAGRHHSKKQKR
jgi:hypothetical protein